MAVPMTWGCCQLLALLGYRHECKAYLSYIRRDDSSFGHDIEKDVQPSREESTAGLGQVKAADGAELDGETLEEDGKDVAQQDDEEKAELV